MNVPLGTKGAGMFVIYSTEHRDKIAYKKVGTKIFLLLILMYFWEFLPLVALYREENIQIKCTN